MRLKIILLYIFLFNACIIAQRPLKISVSHDNQQDYISYFLRKGNVYVSAKELGELLSGNYFYNSETVKIVLKFTNYNLKITAKNQFIILKSRNDNAQYVYQIPISSLLIKDDVYIPLEYCLKYVNLALEKELIFDEGSKNIIVTGKRINTLAFLQRVGPTYVIEKSPPAVSVSSPYDIYGISIEEKSNGTLIRINSKKKISKYSSSIKDGVLYLFLTGVKVDPSLFQKVETSGLVKKIKSQVVKGNYQFEFLLKEGYSSHEAFNDIDNNDILLTVHSKLLENLDKNTGADKSKWSLDVIVIDPGHGGKDPGAIGVSGTKEKDINLDIALKLGKLIERNLNDIKVVYTRNSDQFVELYKRGKIANENNGKLFISLHCNSLRKKPSSINGFEVYLLRPGRTQEAIAIAEFENSVINYEDNPARYQELTDENFILVSMAHSSYMRYSENFSDKLNQELGKISSLESRGVKQAGFYVLVGASMPGVLIETGYLSNRKDEAYLKSSKGKNEIVKKMFDAIKIYKTYYDKMIKDEV